MAADARFRIASLMLCDDIRREDNGKAILIGVYSGDIVLAQVPVVLGFSLWLEGHAEVAASELRIRARAISDDEKSQESLVPPAGMAINIEAGNDFIVVLKGIPVPITGAGNVIVELQYGDDKWQEIVRKRIVIANPLHVAAERQQHV